MNLRRESMLKLRKRRKNWLYPKIEIAELRRKLEYLVFENEFILGFLQKYLIVHRNVNNNSTIPDIVEEHDPSIFLYNQFVGNHQRMLK
jgi:hypothetical protein